VEVIRNKHLVKNETKRMRKKHRKKNEEEAEKKE
jgi:hypothetical protein